MAASYLARCLEMFPETMEARYGWRPDYEGLERELEPVRQGRRELSFKDLETIQNGRYWDFRQFWRFPAESDLAQSLDWGRMGRLIKTLPLDEEDAIARLDSAFKSIENVSVILRFVNPQHYGIISAPVEKVLEVRRGRTGTETYLNYLRDLRDIRDHHKLERAADADMALWVLQERVLSSYRDQDLLRQYRADTWLLRRRAVNLLGELGGADDTLTLARALVEAQLPLAGALASFELERGLRARLGALDRLGGDLSLPAVIERLAEREGAGAAAAWRRAQRVRDQFVCPVGGARKPTREETLDLIQQAEKLKEENQRRESG